jgi:hypothetical protein
MINMRVAARKTFLIFPILTLLCSLSGGLRLSWDRRETVSDSAVRSKQTSARTSALVNAQNARAEVHLPKPKSAKHHVSLSAAPQRLSSLNSSAGLFSFAEHLPRYFPQYRTQHTGRAPPHFN